MLKNLLNNKIKVFVLLLLVLVLASIRIFEESLFYDPYLDYFKTDFTNFPMPVVDKLSLFLSLVFRYSLNSIVYDLTYQGLAKPCRIGTFLTATPAGSTVRRANCAKSRKPVTQAAWCGQLGRRALRPDSHQRANRGALD